MTRFALPGQIVQRPRPPHGVLVLVVLLAIVAGAYWLSSRHASAAASAPSVTAAPQAAPADPEVEDATNHLRHIQQALVRIQENSRRLDQRLNQVSPVLEQNYLHLERQRLEAADLLSNSVLRDAGEALDELELTNQSLKNRRK